MIQLGCSDNPAADNAVLSQGLIGFNVRKVGYYDPKPLTMVARDEHGLIVGGLAGLTYWNCLYLETFWLDDAVRGQGHGRKLLEMVEAEARQRGCTLAYTYTFDYQAPDFYVKHGYQVFGLLPNAFLGHDAYFVKKYL